METIIVPTDFSPVAFNAAEYALKLAGFLNARIILVNAFHPFLPSNYQGGFSPETISSQQELVYEKLTAVKKEMLRLNGGNFDIELVAEMGFSIDVISSIARKENADLIVIGITGEAGKAKRHIIGSTALDVARNVDVPTFIIPDSVKYQPVKIISFACDMDKTEETDLVGKALYFSRLFGAELEIVNVDKPGKPINVEKAVSNQFVEQNLRNVKHETVHLVGNNTTHELESYFDTHETDLIMLNPKKHNLFYRLFNYSITKELAFHSKSPILTIH